MFLLHFKFAFYCAFEVAVLGDPEVEFAGFEDEFVVQAEKFEAGDGKVEGNIYCLASGDFYAAEVFEFQYGTDYRAYQIADVKLNHRRTVNAAGVGNFARYFDDVAFGEGCAGDC